MSLWVKICGNTSLTDALLAAEAGADAIGFVFAAGSPRHVTAEQVREITPHLPVSLEKIGVFVEADCDSIAETVESCGLTGVQLHAADESRFATTLRARLQTGRRILQVIHFADDAAERMKRVQEESAVDGVLVDSRTATAVGGTGLRFDWIAAKAALFRHKTGLRLIAAGGLSPENVAEAVATLQPWGVDVVTGVEDSPGRKDAAKVRAFVAAARMAAGRQVFG